MSVKPISGHSGTDVQSLYTSHALKGIELYTQKEIRALMQTD